MMKVKTEKTFLLTDFSGAISEPRWHAINDEVMGGESQGGPKVDAGQLLFTGVTSLENNGGFSSIRTDDCDYDLSEYSKLLLRVKGDGRIYQVRLYTDASYGQSRIAYAATFPTVAGEWAEPEINFHELKPTFRGRDLAGPAFNASKVEQLGFLIADKQAGPFRLAVDWVRSST